MRVDRMLATLPSCHFSPRCRASPRESLQNLSRILRSHDRERETHTHTHTHTKRK